MSLCPSALIREVRPAPHRRPVDIRVTDGIVSEIGPRLRHAAGEETHDGGGRLAIPGLWDQHVHMGQWAASRTRLDVSEATSVEEVCALVARHVATLRDPHGTVVGMGFRTATWSEQPSVARLDEVSGEHRVVLISGDCHSGWLNSRALWESGLAPRDEVVLEREWFDAFPRVEALPGVAEQALGGYRLAARQASARGIVGIVDMEFARGFESWPDRFRGGPKGPGIDTLRVRVATYPDGLEDVFSAGLRTGSPLTGCEGLVTMGPLKIISDGSLNTRTAFCCEPYADADTLPSAYGMQNVPPGELIDLLRRANTVGLRVAVHAIGDAAARDALDALAATGARGSIEHAQLLRWEDIPRMADLGVVASVQPAHLLDDRDVTRQCWPDRVDRCFAFRSLSDAGVRLVLGSDAPVSPLDPWHAMAAAVHRSADDRDPWVAHQSLTVAEALAASTDGRSRITPGGPADIALLDADPLAVGDDSREAACALREMQVGATFVAGRLTHGP